MIPGTGKFEANCRIEIEIAAGRVESLFLPIHF